MTKRKKGIVVLVAVFLLAYLAVGTAVVLRHVWWADPGLAATTYLDALRKRDAPTIYLYSDMLGAHLSGMMAKSNLTADAQKHMWAKDFIRWKTEFERGTDSMDSLRREGTLINPIVKISPEEPGEYRAEVSLGEDLNLETYRDIPGEVYHRYFRLAYTSSIVAPTVSVFQNVHTGSGRKIKTVVVRVEVRRRPEVGTVKSLLLEWTWLNDIGFLFPTGLFAAEGDPSRVWATKLSFNIDKLTLETF